MAHFEAVVPQSLAAQVAAQIRDQIASGRLSSGTRLVEADLARQMGISRAPVRDALRRLEFEGLVEGRIRRGYVVRKSSVDELHEIYDLRILLEPILAESATRRIEQNDVLALRTVVDQMREAGRQHDWPEVINADRKFHAMVAALSGRSLTAQIFEHLNEQIRRFMALMSSSYERAEEMAEEHEALLAALASGNPNQAEQAMRSHLEDARQRLALILGENRGTDSNELLPAVRR